MMTTLVRHVMTEAPERLPVSGTAADAAGLMADHDVGAIPVTGEDGGLAGIVTDRDLVTRVLANGRDPREVPLGEIVTAHALTVTPDEQVSVAQEMMAAHQIRRLAVMKGDDLVGMLSLGDVALAAASSRMLGETLERISESPKTEARNAGPDVGTPEQVREGEAR